MAARLILVRHGESEGRGLGSLHSRADVSLTPRGRALAESVASLLPRTGGDVAYFTGPLMRARDTAAHVAARVRVDACLCGVSPAARPRAAAGRCWPAAR